ncbi:MAG: hypothetical protein COA32_09700 [Fluviicola sp.]|nr:MAG: hypothetical protein COA32_09700 [Fluviicola sp.]
MNDSLIKLETYFREAERTKHDDGTTAYLLATSSKKAIEALREYQAQSDSVEVKTLCEETIARLHENKNLIKKYGESCVSDNLIGDYLIFAEINHTLYNALESFLVQIGHL